MDETILSSAELQVAEMTVMGEKGTSTWNSLAVECNNQGYSSQTVDGIAGNKTLAGCPLLGTKSRGKITALLQEYLNGLGYDCGKIDGINGKNTQKAIKKFQQDNGLRADGIVGLKTWKAILNL